MSNEFSQPLRVELTILDEKLLRDDLQFHAKPAAHLLYATPYEQAVTPPFPVEGKRGLSLFIGRLEQFRQAEVPLLWELERKRGRPRMAVVTNLRGKGFAPAVRELESSLGDPMLTPISFLRRRGKTWDSLDFFSSGDSESMKGAAPRLKRLKQRGWESVVDHLAFTDPKIKAEYFQSLHVDRPVLQEAFLEGLVAGRVSAMVGIAGQCLQKEHLALLLQEEINQRILQACQLRQEFQMAGHWHFLSKRSGAEELILMAPGEKWLDVGQVLSAKGPDSSESEFLVAKTLQRLQISVSGSDYTCIRVRVEWRYRPDREIPVIWTQNSISPAGSRALHG